MVVKGEEITLTNKEFELLLLMAENANIVFSKERLFDRIWGLDTGSGLGDGYPTVHRYADSFGVGRFRNKI